MPVSGTTTNFATRRTFNQKRTAATLALISTFDAAEMFVIINSTPTRINKSHLVDLYERVSWAEPRTKQGRRP